MIVSAIFLLFVAATVFLFRARIFADTILGEPSFENSADVDINSDGKAEKLSLKIYQTGITYESFLVVDNFWGPRSLELNGFENEVNFCQEKTYDFSGQRLLCLVGDVGAHSRNIQFIAWKNGSLQAVNFEEDRKVTANLISDQPNFQIFAAENKVTSDMRNYELDPMSNITRKTYSFNSGVFTFSGAEDIVYSEE